MNALTVAQSTETNQYTNKSIDVLLNMWLHSKSKSTQDIYKRVANKFLIFVNKPLVSVGLDDLQQWVDSLSSNDNTKKTYSHIIKSLSNHSHPPHFKGKYRKRY